MWHRSKNFYCESGISKLLSIKYPKDNTVMDTYIRVEYSHKNGIREDGGVLDMPYTVKHMGGKRPYKIVKEGGKVVGSSTSMAKAMSSIKARLMAEHGMKPKRRSK